MPYPERRTWIKVGAAISAVLFGVLWWLAGQALAKSDPLALAALVLSRERERLISADSHAIVIEAARREFTVLSPEELTSARVLARLEICQPLDDRVAPFWGLVTWESATGEATTVFLLDGGGCEVQAGSACVERSAPTRLWFLVERDSD